MTHLQIAFESGLDRGVVDVDLVQFGAERGVAAVVGPVGIDHLDLGDRGLASLFGEVLLAELKIGQIHGEPALVDELLAGSGVHLVEAGDGLDLAGGGHLGLQRGLGFQRRLAGLDRVDHVMLDGIDVGLAERAFERVHLGGAHGRTLTLRDQLDALCGGVGALVELSGQELGGEHRRVAEVRQVRGGVIHLRLAEHGRRGLFEELLGDALDVIAVDDAHLAQAIDAEDGLQFGAELLGFHVEAGLLLHVHAKNHENPFLRSYSKNEEAW